MPIAAAPDYLMHDFKELTPGQRFGTFFPVWSANWSKDDDAKTEALKKVTTDFLAFKPLVSSLVKRQELVAAGSTNMFTLPAVSTSPFMTGTGMEHPLENGFAFLQPYGMPYLPGSSIKGVLRRTAELLAAGEFNGETHGWDAAAIDALFGPEPRNDEDASRGALQFWDVVIEPKDYKLDMDILTPHFGEYYFGKATPHESGQPVPNPFLVVPPGAKFTFHIQCNKSLIGDESLKASWSSLVQVALEHAFEWMGFGAKTAVGYGQLASMELLEQQHEKAYVASLAQSGISIGSHTWEKAEICDRNAGAGTYRLKEQGSGQFALVKASEFPLSESVIRKLKKGKNAFVKAQVEEQGNLWVVKSIQDFEP